MQKIVYSFHPKTLAFSGPVLLDESDISPLEPGVWVIPAGCLEAEPPAVEYGYFAKAVDGKWEIAKIPKAPFSVIAKRRTAFVLSLIINPLIKLHNWLLEERL